METETTYNWGHAVFFDIAGAPQELKKLGTIQNLNKILESKLNDTIKGLSNGLDEIFCSLSHKESDQIVKIMRFCDKNVVHFYYLPRLFGEYKLHLDSNIYMGKTVYTNHLEPLSSISNRIDKYIVRHFSKPGITGWAQVTGFRGETKELWQMEERIKRDIWYIENWSFWLDIRIILLTAKSIICPDKNAY